MPFSIKYRVWTTLFLWSLLIVSPAAGAAESKAKAKGIPANPAKKKVKGIPTQPKASSNAELTEEEKALVADIANRVPAEPPVAREKVILPPEVLAARPPMVPQTRASRPPSLPLGDPHVFLRPIPQAPKRVSTPVTKADAPATDPTKKKR